MTTKFGIDGSAALLSKARTHKEADTHTQSQTPLIILPRFPPTCVITATLGVQ